MIYLGDKNGGYAAIPKKPESKYHGVFFSEDSTLIKGVEDIRFTTEKEFFEEEGALREGSRKWKDGTEEMFLFENDTFLYEKNTDDEVELILDIKQSYDDREFGRCYQIRDQGTGNKNQKTKVLQVEFSKKNDERESPGKEYSAIYIIRIDGNFSLEERWAPKKYPLDEKREGNKKERYVFVLLKTTAKKISIRKQNSECRMQNFVGVIPCGYPIKNQISAFNFAKNALLSLLSNMHGRTGILAGHPWFFQYWTRDEAISAKGLYLTGKKNETKQILINAIKHIDKTGRIPNRIPSADLSSADGVGWTFFRLKELYELGELSKKESEEIKKWLDISLSRIEKHIMDDGLVENARLETWMDTGFQNDDRSGKRIEIQALTLAMYEFLFLLTKLQSVRLKAEKLKKRTKEVFWNGEYLKDGSDDETIRPNVFLAYYIYPDILKSEEWQKCFDVALEKLWLDWGGLATIDKRSPLFCDTHTGQNNQSYHRGDSWYFVNNIVAICLFRLNKKYTQYAERIFEASKKDLLEFGAKGCCSEVSSARQQTSEGCFNQAWSNATFLELVEEMKKR